MQSRIFKGATRPAMVMGVPLVPMVLLCLGTILPIGWMIIFKAYVMTLVMLALWVMGYGWLKIISKRDPWQFKQSIIKRRLRRTVGNMVLWKGISYGPLASKKREL